MAVERACCAGQTLDSREAKKAFSACYLNDVYDLAMTLSRQDADRARAMVLDVFQRAFQKYMKTPCPPDCHAYLYSELYLVSAQGGPSQEAFRFIRPHTGQDAPEQTVAAQEPAGSAEQPPPVTEPRPTVVVEAEHGPTPAEPDRQTQPADDGTRTEGAARSPAAGSVGGGRGTAGRNGPRHAAEERSEAQPVYTQVFDPNFTAYWTVDMDEPSAAGPEPAAYAPETRPEPAAYAPETQPEPQREAPPPETQASPAPQEEGPQQTSQAYMYDKQKAKTRKLPLLTVINTVLGLTLVWTVIGLLITMDYLPQWNLGYSWFNLNIYPLF